MLRRPPFDGYVVTHAHCTRSFFFLFSFFFVAAARPTPRAYTHTHTHSHHAFCDCDRIFFCVLLLFAALFQLFASFSLSSRPCKCATQCAFRASFFMPLSAHIQFLVGWLFIKVSVCGAFSKTSIERCAYETDAVLCAVYLEKIFLQNVGPCFTAVPFNAPALCIGEEVCIKRMYVCYKWSKVSLVLCCAS